MKVADIEVKLIDSMGSDLSVVNAARVSFDKESDWEMVGHEHDYTLQLSAADTRLINYLARHKHYSPFNHTFLTFRIKAPIFVARQLVKHEYLPWNEVSRRYVDSEPGFYLPEYLRARSDSVKQGSSSDAIETNKEAMIGLTAHTQNCLDYYNVLTKYGVCPEQARIVLPHNLMTEWIWSGTLKAFHKMLSLRLDPHTQYETRIVAEKILPLIEQHFPISIKALLDESE